MTMGIRVAIVGSMLAAGAASADIITQWNFNSNPADGNTSTGTLVPSVGTGTPSTQGGITTSFASGAASGGSTDPAATDNSGWQTTTYPAQGAASGTAGVRFDASTAGFFDIVVSWDQRFSNTSNRFYQFEYTLDGSVMNPVWIAAASLENTGGGDVWVNNNSVNLAGIAGVDNNAHFAFRIVSVFGPAGAYVASNPTSTYSGAGTWRFDMVTVRGVVPTPGAAALMALGGLTALRRRR